ncbi:putative methyltransferase [Skeletonema marinoi]|uniref:Ribosomal RNA-processing protein 8 n=1 Tax=Skeletonema marinoi TaxID=267567 RepID=A0AAD8YP72_9STRA|nr:putative methyltransferase [Skeletonema marinoi]
MTDTNIPSPSSKHKPKDNSNKMSKKKKQSPDRVEAAAKLPASPMSTSAKSQPSTPVNNDDPSTWTKSKKKRMRQSGKEKKKQRRSCQWPKKQSTSNNDSDDITNKRQKVEATKQSPADANSNDIESSPKKKKKKKNKKKKKDTATDDATETTTENSSTLNKTDTSDTNTSTQSNSSSSSKPQMKISLPKPSMMSTLQKAFLERLTSSRFRELNEDLYTKPSQDSFKQFTERPELFDQYHVGFQDCDYVEKGGSRSKGNKGKRENVVVADFGCGDAKLAESDGQLTNQPSKKMKKGKQSDDKSSCPFDVYSFDLVSGGNPLVTPADMSNVPLSDESIDVAVYCLALMGTNVADFVRESWRVLKFNGVLRVAEVRSRFETASAKAMCTNMDRSNKMFLFMDFVKVDGGSGLAEHENFSAKPCIYKRR